MLIRNHYIVTKLATACLSILFLIVMYVPSASAHSDTHAPSVTTTQKHTDSVYKGTFFQTHTENHIAFEDRVPAKDDCDTNCCKRLADAIICSNTRLCDEGIFYVDYPAYESQDYLSIASSVKFVYSLTHSPPLQNTLQYRVLLI